MSRDHARVVRRPDGLYIEDAGSLNGTYVNRHRIESHRLADGDELQIGQVQADLPRPLMREAMASRATVGETRRAAPDDRRRLRARSSEDFPDISISKIRYLEDQKLLAPRRTRGGYRLYSEDDVERLRRILKLQRDEFLPLRVIREELRSPRGDRRAPRPRRRAPGAPAHRPQRSRPSELCGAVRRARRSWCASSRTSR